MKAVRRVKTLTCFHMKRVLSYVNAAYISRPTAGVTEYWWYLNVAVIPPHPSAPDQGLEFVEGYFRLHTVLQQTAILLTPVQGYGSNFANNYWESPLERRGWWGKWLRICHSEEQIT
jgi:hypothetical protein